MTDHWSSCLEQVNSIVLYVTQLGLCRVSPGIRILCLMCLIFLAHQKAHWSIILFYGGFLLAELDVRRTERAAAKRKRDRIVWYFVYVLVFLCALCLGAQPERRCEQAPGWATLISWIPAQFEDKARYWTTWGALLLVWSTSRSLPLQRIFTNEVSQYLGKISFSLYLLHGNIIHTLGYGSFEFFWHFTGTATYFRREFGFILAAICVFTATVWLADIFMRLVDGPSVRFAKWLEEWCLAESRPEEKPAWRDTRELF